MALFGLKKTTKTEKAAPAKAKAVKTTKAVKPVAVASLDASPSNTRLTQVILRPRVTEKSGLQSQNGVYTFEVTANANKNMVAAAVKALYKVTPVKVGVINQGAKNVFVKGRHGTVAGFRKAMVTLKEGEKIDFV